MKPFKAKIVFEHKTYNGTIDVEQYQDGKPALMYNGKMEPIADLSKWVEGLNEGEVAIKTYGENPFDLHIQLQKLDVIKAPHRMISSGFVKMPVCYLSDAFAQRAKELANQNH